MTRFLRPSVPVALAIVLLVPCGALADPASPPTATSPPKPAAAALPDDLPIYARAVPISSMASPTQGTIVSLRSEDAPATILEWYDAEFARRGWVVERRNETSGRHLLTALKSARKASLLITTQVSAASADRDESQILLVVTEER